MSLRLAVGAGFMGDWVVVVRVGAGAGVVEGARCEG